MLDPSRSLTVSDNRILKLKIYLNGASDGITPLSVHDADEIMEKYGRTKVNRCIYYNETYYRLINLYS
ncbi:hypothetical protein McpCs1_08510 [Methanocorpusculaceae archaeon Cs1]|uniref:Uncharacterized protein n=2 Tax=Methanorbis rubei TaxID=3028300 RepID=A0AAE4MFU9_9EURY|nr:hypothetical protein [Methanocorpusculaceae archaeon Cs1]